MLDGLNQNSGAGSGSIDKPLLMLQFKETNYTLQPKTKDRETRPSATSHPAMTSYDIIITDLGDTIHLPGGASQNVELEYHLNASDFPAIVDDIKKREILESLCWNLTFKSKNVAQLKLKSPYQILYKSPKITSISQMLPDRDSNPN